MPRSLMEVAWPISRTWASRGPERLASTSGCDELEVAHRVVDEVLGQVGQDRPARGPGVQRVLRPDLDDHLHLLRALELVEVDPAMPHEHRQGRRLAGLVAQPLQDRCRDAAYVELAPGLGAEPDGSRPERVRRVARARPGPATARSSDCRIRCTTALLRPTSRASWVTPSGRSERANASRTSATRFADSVPVIGRRPPRPGAGVVSSGPRFGRCCSAERTLDLAQICAQPL